MKNFIFIFLLCLCKLSYAQNIFENNTLPVVAYWDSGKKMNGTYIYEQIETKETIKNVTKITNNFSWEVVSYKNKKYEILLTFNQCLSIEKSDTFWTLYFNSLKSIPIKYSTNEMGMFDSLNDLISLQNKVFNNIDSTVFKLNWTITESLSLTINGLKNTIRNLESFKNFIYEDLINLHLFYGLEYQLNRPYNYNAAMPSLIGGTVYPAIKTLKLANVIENTSRLKMNIKPKTEEFKDIHFNNLKEFFSQIGSNFPSKKEIENSQIYMELENIYSVDFAYPISVKFTHFSDQILFQTKIIKTFTFN